MSISVGKKATTLAWQRMKGSMFHLGEEVDVDLDFSRSFGMSPITSYRQTDGIWTRLVDSEVDWKLPGLKVRDLCCEAILCPKDCYGGKYFITSLLMTLTEYTLSESVHDKNLEGMVNAADGCATIRMEFYRLEKWGEELHEVNQWLWFWRFHWRKTILLWAKNCEPGGNNTTHQWRLGGDPLESSFQKWPWSILVDNWFTMSQQCAFAIKAAKSYLGCTRTNVASQLREIITPLWLALVRHIWNSVSRPGLPGTKQEWTCWSDSSAGPQSSLRDWSSWREERLWELGLLSLEETQGDLSVFINTWVEINKVELSSCQ